MATLTQVPGVLNIVVSPTDDLTVSVDFDLSLTGYTFTAFIEHNGRKTPLTVADVNLSAGQISVSTTNAVLSGIGEGSYSWYLDWNTGTLDRRVLAGLFKIATAA